MKKHPMSQGELRYWIREFLYNPDLGWSHCKSALARCVGIDRQGLKSKIRQGRTQAWIFRGEQIRFTAQIERLLAGELVPVKIGQRWEAMVADHPVPLKVPALMRYDLASGRLGYVAPRKRESQPTLPSFKDVFEKAEKRYVRPA
jgi:hypothetical protein